MPLCVKTTATTGLEACRWGALALLLVAAGPAAAQMQLMPASPGGAEGGDKPAARASSGEPARPRAASKPTFVKSPGEEAILGHLLSFEGAKGAMQFDRTGKDVTVSKLTLPGERLSKPTEACQVDVVAAQPIVAASVGRPQGALRWQVAVEACPFTVDVLDGAALVSSGQPTCDFAAADCRVHAVGLWGPPGGAITPARVKELERERVQAETVMRTNFRVLLQRAGKDRAAVKAIAGEQAAFSSQREMTCRDYARESVHGFCSAQITEARSLAILAKFPGEADKAPPKKSLAGGHPKKALAKAAAPEPPPPQADEKP